jgi:hypothetical protein
MYRVRLAFAFFVAAHLAFAFAMRGSFGTAGALTVAGTGVGGIALLGVPAFLLFRRRGWLAWWQLGAGGAVLGLACALPFAVAGTALATALAPAFAALGMLHGILFWLLALWRNRAFELGAR